MCVFSAVIYFTFIICTNKAYPSSGLLNYRPGESLCKPVFPVLYRFKSYRRSNNSCTQ